jgi:hypothetical protein
MAIRYYDEALVAKIKSWVKDPNLTVLKPDEVSRLFRQREDQTEDKPLSLPLIALSRDKSVQIDANTKRPMSFNGMPVDATAKKTLHLDAIPITVNYQIDIFTQRYDEGDEYLRNFIFKLINEPALKILIPYNGVQLEHIAFLRVMSTVTDNSDISEKLFPDQFTRWTIELELQDAYLFSVPFTDNWTLEAASLDTVENASTPTIYEEEKIDIKQ